MIPCKVWPDGGKYPEKVGKNLPCGQIGQMVKSMIKRSFLPCGQIDLVVIMFPCGQQKRTFGQMGTLLARWLCQTASCSCWFRMSAFTESGSSVSRYQKTERSGKLPSMMVSGFGRSQSSKAVAASQAHHNKWLKSINAQSTSLNTVAKYYDAKYNNAEEYQLLSKYSYSVQHGKISPIAGFDNYISGHHRIQTELVGHKAANNLEITGQSMHFMERVLGTIKDSKDNKPRSGVEVDDVISCVLTGRVRGVKFDNDGRPSILFFSEKCGVVCKS